MIPLGAVALAGRGGQEPAEALLEQLWLRALLCSPRDEDPALVITLQAMEQHWAVLLVEDVLTHLDNQVGTDADEVLVEGRMVQLA